MITLVIGLFIGAILGFVFAALLARGKRADDYELSPMRQDRE